MTGDPGFQWEGQTASALTRRLGLPDVELHDSLGSTNDRARELARTGAEPFTLVVADRQTAGRGRGGRAWHSPEGRGVWASLVVESAGPEVDGVLPLRVGLALAACLERLSHGVIRLKWPNDLFLEGDRAPAKVGGILCERIATGAGSGGLGPRVVVGVGLNVLPVQVESEYPAGALEDAGLKDRIEVLSCVVDAVRLAASARGETLTQDEREAWCARDLLWGRRVQVVGPAGERERGTARGVDARGHFLVASAAGLSRVVGGTVRPLDAVDGGRGRAVSTRRSGAPGP